MKKYMFYCILLYSSYVYGTNDTILSVSFIEDSLHISSATYTWYRDRDGKIIEPSNEAPRFFLIEETDDPLKEFVLKFDTLSYNCLDTTLTVIGTIRGVEEKPLRPEKNVNIFIGGGFHKTHGVIYGSRPVGQPYLRIIDGSSDRYFPIYVLNNWKTDYALLEKGHEPTLQTFNSQFKLEKGDKYLIFVVNGYKPKVISLNDVCFPYSP